MHFTTPTCYGKFVPSSGNPYGYNLLYIRKFSSLVYELPEDGTDVTNHVGVVKNQSFKYICRSYI